MSIIGSFGGWSIIAIPSSPGFKQVEFSMSDSVDATPSPWTGQVQIIDWGVDWWMGTASLPPMKRPDAQQWIAFLAECRGAANVFQVGDPLGGNPVNVRGIPVTNGSNLARSQTLNVKGLQAYLQRQFLPGDYIQIGYRLYMNLGFGGADANGNTTLTIWPRLREDVPDGTVLVLDKPKGLFRLADNKRSFSLANTKHYGIDFAITEAL